jgi:hypothetical protein
MLLKEALQKFINNRSEFEATFVDSYDDLEMYEDKYWFKYQDPSTGKWNVVPKAKAFEVAGMNYELSESETS